MFGGSSKGKKFQNDKCNTQYILFFVKLALVCIALYGQVVSRLYQVSGYMSTSYLSQFQYCSWISDSYITALMPTHLVVLIQFIKVH